MKFYPKYNYTLILKGFFKFQRLFILNIAFLQNSKKLKKPMLEDIPRQIHVYYLILIPQIDVSQHKIIYYLKIFKMLQKNYK